VSSDFGDPKHGVPALKSSPVSNMLSTTGIEENLIIADEPVLFQNYPNPFNPDTNISFSLSTKSNVELTLFNSAGQEIRKIIDRQMDKGIHSVTLKAEELNSGVYFYTLKAQDKEITNKMVLVK
jgi:hypothetical protein